MFLTRRCFWASCFSCDGIVHIEGELRRAQIGLAVRTDFVYLLNSLGNYMHLVRIGGRLGRRPPPDGTPPIGTPVTSALEWVRAE